MMNDLGGKHPERPSKGGREKKKNNKNKAEMKRPSTSFASVVFFFLSLSLSFPWKYFIASRWFYDF
jgi:hypothetical protein